MRYDEIGLWKTSNSVLVLSAPKFTLLFLGLLYRMRAINCRNYYSTIIFGPSFQKHFYINFLMNSKRIWPRSEIVYCLSSPLSVAKNAKNESWDARFCWIKWVRRYRHLILTLHFEWELWILSPDFSNRDTR